MIQHTTRMTVRTLAGALELSAGQVVETQDARFFQVRMIATHPAVTGLLSGHYVDDPVRLLSVLNPGDVVRIAANPNPEEAR